MKQQLFMFIYSLIKILIASGYNYIQLMHEGLEDF